MSDVTNGSALDSDGTLAAPASNDSAMQAYMLSARAAVKSQGVKLEAAQRNNIAAKNTLAAILLHMCLREAVITLNVKAKGKDKKEGDDKAHITMTLENLIALDRNDNRDKNSTYKAALAFIEAEIDQERSTARNIVDFTARAARLGYRLDHWNGQIITAQDGSITVQTPDYHDDMQQHEWPGLFRIKPEHLASTSEFDFLENVELADYITAYMQGKPVQVPVPAKVQEVCISDRNICFLYGHKAIATGEKPNVRRRIGMDTFLKVTAAIIDSEETKRKQAADAAEARKNREAHDNGQSTTTSGPGNPNRGEGEGEPATTPPEKPQAAPSGQGVDKGTPAGTTTPAPASNAPASGSAPATDNSQAAALKRAEAAKADAEAKLKTAQNDAAKANAERERTRLEAEQLKNGWTAPKVADWVRQNVSTARVKDDPEWLAAAMLMYTNLHGVLKTSKKVDEAFLSNPAAANKASRNGR